MKCHTTWPDKLFLAEVDAWCASGAQPAASQGMVPFFLLGLDVAK